MGRKKQQLQELLKPVKTELVVSCLVRIKEEGLKHVINTISLP